MAKFTLSIETEEVHELKGLVDKLAGGAQLVVHDEPVAEVEAEKPKAARTRRVVKEDPAPVAEPIAPAPVEPVKEFAAEVEKAASPPPIPTQEAPAEQVSYETAKSLVTTCLDRLGGNKTRDVLLSATGVGAISHMQPSQYAVAYAAMQAALKEAGAS